MSEKIEKILVPDIGGSKNVNVVEVSVKSGDQISVDQPLITLEGEKASIDVPSPFAGEVSEVKIKVGDKVSEGDVILLMKIKGDVAPSAPSKGPSPIEKPAAEKIQTAAPKEKSLPVEDLDAEDLHAGPGVRRIAHEFGLNLNKIKGSGPKNRILKEDLQQYVKQQLRAAETGSGGLGLSLPPMPSIDFSKFGEISSQALSKIKRASGANLHRNWVSIPHVTQFDEADITDLEIFRKKHQEEAQKLGFKLTPLVFILKAVVAALKQFPTFNASLDEKGENIILKKYFNIGVAVDTPNGLVVPVLRNVDKKTLFELAKELNDISQKAREKGLSLSDMQGGCFSISSLGGIGGTAFTPIVNAPEVAILGVSKSSIKLIHQANNEFIPRLMLPLSLSYDHRVIDGAEGARFITYLASRLSDIGTLLM